MPGRLLHLAAPGYIRAAGALLMWLVVPVMSYAAYGVSDDAAIDDRSRPLHERQDALRARVARLENRMLELAKILAESEPAKAERLRDTLDLTGELRIREQLDSIVALLRENHSSAAGAAQAAAIEDLRAVLELLTSSLNELDRLREERARLEDLKRAVRVLLDEQLDALYRTQHARQQTERDPGEPGDPSAQTGPPKLGAPESSSGRDVRQLMERLEEMQREVHRRAMEVEKSMQQRREGDAPMPGAKPMQQARQSMQGAAEQFGRQDAEAGEEQQRAALDNLQETLDELDDALRQVRQEEREETLAALETRLRSLLSQERRVRDAVEELAAQPAEAWTRLQELRLSETSELHADVIEQAGATLRILRDEGTTVIIPELFAQMIEDMAQVAGLLQAPDLSAPTRALLDEIISQLQEIVDAVKEQRDQDAEAGDQPPGAQQGDQARPLLPPSAELKLMRAMQVRLNDRSVALADEIEGEPGAAADEARDAFGRTAERQLRLAEQARAMNERQ